MGRRDTLLLSILTLVTSLAWIAFDIYHAYVDTTILADVEAQLAPITPKFDEAVLGSVKKRQNVEPLLTQGPPLPSPRPSSPSATATQSGGQ